MSKAPTAAQIDAALTPEKAPAIGHNSREVLTPEEIAAFLAESYATTETAITQLLAGARTDIPAKVETDEQDGIVGKYVADIRDALKDIEARRVAEKAPYLAATRAIDAFFGAKTARLETASKVIHARGNDYNVRKEAAARAEANRVATEAATAAREAAKEEAAKRAAAEEALRAAARARKPERIDELTALAQEAAAQVDAAQVEAAATHDQAVTAQHAANATAADLVRTRHETGVMSTMAQEGFAEVVDRNKLDFALLAAHFKIEHIEMALKKYAAQNGFACTMAGANIGKRPKTVYK